MQVARMVPNFAFGSWNTIVKSIATNIGPAIGSSVGFVGKWLSGSNPAPESENRLHWKREYGVSTEFLDTIGDAALGAMYKENTVGANSEARLCLKKAGNGTWGECEDFQDFVRMLVAQERSREQEAKLRVKMLFAEDDALIGREGQRYMEACWDRDGEFADVLEFTSATVDDSDHDSLMMMAAVMEEVIGDAVAVNVGTSQDGVQ